MRNLPRNRQRTHGTKGGADAGRENLTRAFLSFTQAAGSLERSYGQLQAEVGRLHQELERTNTELDKSLEENARVRKYLARVLESLPCGVLVVNPQGEVQIANPEARRLLQVRSGMHVGKECELPEAVRRMLNEPQGNSFFVEQEFASATASGWSRTPTLLLCSSPSSSCFTHPHKWINVKSDVSRSPFRLHFSNWESLIPPTARFR